MFTIFIMWLCIAEFKKHFLQQPLPMTILLTAVVVSKPKVNQSLLQARCSLWELVNP